MMFASVSEGLDSVLSEVSKAIIHNNTSRGFTKDDNNNAYDYYHPTAGEQRRNRKRRPKVQINDTQNIPETISEHGMTSTIPSPDQMNNNYWLSQSDPSYQDQEESAPSVPLGFGRRRKTTPNPTQNLQDAFGSLLSNEETRKALLEKIGNGALLNGAMADPCLRKISLQGTMPPNDFTNIRKFSWT